ncbi:MAG: amidohydrolase family protein, partial [Flavitalea sp.]
MSSKCSLLVYLLIFFLGKTFGQDTSVIVIENVNIIPMTEEIVLYNQRVLIANGKIAKIEPSIKRLNVSATLRIDGTGKYLIPGLSEMHYHFRSNDIESDFKLLIANGITTVRNMSEGAGQDHIAIKRKNLSGELLPLNYFTTGPYLQSKDLQTETDVRNVVQQHKKRGYDFL